MADALEPTVPDALPSASKETSLTAGSGKMCNGTKFENHIFAPRTVEKILINVRYTLTTPQNGTVCVNVR